MTFRNGTIGRSTNPTSAQADILGVACSVGCAIHCAATPILLSVLPSLASLRWLSDPLFHQVVAVLCAVFVTRAILPGWRLHRRQSVVCLAVSGISLLFAAAFVLPHTCSDHPVLLNHSPQARVENLHAQRGNDLSVLPADKIRLISTQAALTTAQLRSDFSADTSAHYYAASVDHGFATWGRSLLTPGHLLAALGPQVSQKLLVAQQYFSTLGGILLIVAHLLNMQFCCGCSSCCSPTCKAKPQK